MIFTERQITVRKGKATIDEPVILYRGDFEVSIKFTIMESKFRFKSGVNLVDSEKAPYGQLAILAPYGGNVFSDVVKCEDGTVTFTLTEEMIDQLEEVGLYSFQIRLFDYYRESRVSIPPVEFGIEVREPVASEDHDNEVNNAIVGYSIAKVVDPKEENVGPTFDANGNYNKTDWETGDRITEGKLNKIEDALDKINQNEKNDVAALDKRVTNNFNVLDASKADKTELDVERSRINNLTKLPSGSTSGDAELIDIRTDIFGVSNTNAGTAVRNQIRRVYFSDSATVSQTLTDTVGKTYVFNYRTLGASTLSITLSATEVIRPGSMCEVGIRDLAGNDKNSLAKFHVGYNDTITLKLDYPIQAVRVYFPGDTIVKTGTVSLYITEQSFKESIDVLNEKMHYIHDVDVQVSTDFEIKDATVSQNIIVSAYIPANTPIKVSIEDGNDIISFDKGKLNIIGGVTTKSDTRLNNLYYFEGTNTAIFQCEDDIKQVNIWVSGDVIDATGTITVNVQGKSLPYQLPAMINELNNFCSDTRSQLTDLADVIGLPLNKHYGTHNIIINNGSDGSYSASAILRYEYKANTPIYLKFSGNGASTDLKIGCHYKNLGYKIEQASVPLNTVVEFIPPDDFTSFNLYTEFTKAGQYTFDVDSTEQGGISVTDLFDDVDDEIERIDNVLGYPTNKILAGYAFYNTETTSNVSQHYVLPYEYKANVPIYIAYESDNGTSTDLVFGCYYKNLGYKTEQGYVSLNTVVEFIPPDDFGSFGIWASSASAGDFKITAYDTPPKSKTVKEEINDIKEEINGIKAELDNEGINIKSGSFSVVGDSWSTFKNWVPEGNALWYPPEAGTQGNGTGNDVTLVQQTWWWQLADRTGMTLYLNDSWSGSTICGTGYGGDNTLSTSAMVTRVKKHMGETKVLGPKPNIIIILAGTNDSAAGSPIGAVQYSNWTESDLMSTLPAFCCMIDYLQTWNPGCRIINVVNPNIKSEIKNGFVTACEHYGIENLVLSGISLTGSHPNIAGMKAIADQIIAIL